MKKMIELENLHDQTIEEILVEAKKQISYLSSEWTNRQESDPGVTLVELFVWLKHVQHEYLNRLSEGVQRKFLELLDVEVRRNKGSKTFLEVTDLKDDVNLPIGTKWLAGDMVFENPSKVTLVKSKILTVKFSNPCEETEVEYYKFSENKTFGIFGDNLEPHKKPRMFYINFDKELPCNKIINLYFAVSFGGDLELKRNPIGSDDEFEEIAKIKWEYYGEENGKLGWHDLEIISDQTHSFLFSGLIRFKGSGKFKDLNAVYTVRATLIHNEYDMPPRVSAIMCNVFSVIGQNTKCKMITLKKNKILEDGKIEIEDHMAIYGDHMVYVNKLGGWVQTQNFVFERNYDSSKLILSVKNIKNIAEPFASDDDVLLVVAYEKDIKHQIILGSGTGASAQYVEFTHKNIKYGGTKLLIGEQKENEMVYSKWERAADFFSSSKYDKHYVIDKQRNGIIFGNHIYGTAPPRGTDNIRLAELIHCFGENSNIQENIIREVNSENAVLKKARINQFLPATGGTDNEPIEHAKARATNLFFNSGRTITVNDYEEIVKNTPGLIFKNIKILPNYIPGEDVTNQNSVTIAVRWNDKIGLTLPQSYKKNILKQIEKHRLINTKINIIGPEYIGLIITGEVVVNSFYKEKDKLIEKEIKNYVRKLNKDLGTSLTYGDFFSEIDRLKYVSYVKALKIIPVGNFLEKTASEDIVIPPNGVYYVKKINLDYVKSSEIYRN